MVVMMLAVEWLETKEQFRRCQGLADLKGDLGLAEQLQKKSGSRGA